MSKIDHSPIGEYHGADEDHALREALIAIAKSLACTMS
jgi:hypothetical protein